MAGRWNVLLDKTDCWFFLAGQMSNVRHYFMARDRSLSLLTGCPAVPSNLARTISYCDLYKVKKCMCTSSGWDLHSLQSHSPVGMSSSSRGGSLWQKKLQYYTHQNMITSQCGKFQVVSRTDSKVCVVVCHCTLKTYDTKNFNCVIQKNVNNYS